MKVKRIDAEKIILEEIADKECTRDNVALTYAFCIDQIKGTSFGKINKAIVARWSMSALEYIKKKAWKIVDGRG